MTLSLETLRRLPKAELHCHLDGSVRPQTILELAEEQGVELPTTDIDELRRLVEVPSDCPSLEVYLRSFAITLKVLQRADAITRVLLEICEDAVNDGIRYLEVRFAPVLHTEAGLSYSTIMEACCQGIALAEARLPITVRVIVCGMRQMDASVSHSMAEIAWRYRERGVVAFDLAGPEYGFPSRDHAEAFQLVHSHWLNCTLHSGEAFGPASINESIRYCGAHRIGHGVRLEEDAGLLQYVRTQRIPLEMCPTSNIQTKAVATIQAHPLARYLRQGLVVVPCTDNTTVSNVRLSGEYELIQNEFGLSVPEIVRLIYNGFHSAFLSPVQRARVTADAMADVARVLAEAGVDPRPAFEQFKTEPEFGAGFPGVEACACACAPTPAPVPAPVAAAAEAEACSTAKVTLDALRRIPKVDLSMRVDRSVPRDALWELVEQLTAEEAAAFLGFVPKSANELIERVAAANAPLPPATAGAPPSEDAQADTAPKRVLTGLLQTPAALTLGVRRIVEAAAADNVIYAELQLVPTAHTEGPMSVTEVVDVALAAAREAAAAAAAAGHPITVNFIVCACVRSDDPVSFHRLAELTIARRLAPSAAAAGESGVVGFGVVGGELAADAMKFYAAAFTLLKNSACPVTMSAGRVDGGAVGAALHAGGASRLSTAYTLHRDPAALNYVAVHRTPVELADTIHLDRHTPDVRTFVSSVARLFFDAKVNLCICSVAQALTGLSLSEMLFNVATNASFSPAELIQILVNPTRAAFLPFEVQEKLAARISAVADAVFAEAGCTELRYKWFFP